MKRLVAAAMTVAVSATISCSPGQKDETAMKAPETPASKTETSPHQIVWNIDNLTSIGGNPVAVEGSPTVIDTPGGRAVEFDGIDDGLFIDVHPLEGAETFTLEVVCKPYSNGPEEQRFFHLQETGSDDRFLIETRIIDGNKWSLDTFIASGDSVNQTLLDKSITHPCDEWYAIALVFDGKEMRHYINGAKELGAPITNYVPPRAGRTSMGVRINKVFWYKGAIRQARYTRSALEPSEFLKP
jgi:hypothetical protein